MHREVNGEIGWVRYVDTDFISDQTFLFLFVTSATCSMILFFVIFFNKETQVQPNTLIALIAFAEFTEVTTFRLKETFCYFKLPDLLSLTVHYKITPETYMSAVRTLTMTGGFFCGFGFRLSVALNIILCIDIV